MAWLFGRNSVSRTLSTEISETINQGAPLLRQGITTGLQTGIVLLEAAQDATISAVTGEDNYEQAVTEWKKRRNIRRSLWEEDDDLLAGTTLS